MARRTYSLESYRLPVAAMAAGFEGFNHHDALAEEYAVMDRAGRVQVPREFREALALTRRVRLALAEDHVQIRSDRDAEEST